MNETKLTKRQNLILNLVNQSSGIGRLEIEKTVASLYPASKPTIARDLAFLARQKVIKSEGQGRSTRYLSAATNPLLIYFDLDQYFALEPDTRVGAQRSFDFGVFDHFTHLFSQQEIVSLTQINKSFSQAVGQLNRGIYLKELERFIIELSWKSSKIEGNTYSLLETEALIKQSVEAAGHSREEAVMILNHKRAFENILQNRGEYKQISLSQITQLHNFIIQDLQISRGIRKQAVGITGTVYRPLDNQWQIQDALEKLVATVNTAQNPLEKALFANTLISYIQPFVDGNKRTGRMLANAILLAHDYYPLSYRSVDEITYKKVLILFYEQNSIYHLKRIFIEQYKFANENYF